MAERELPGIGITGFWELGAAYKTSMDNNLRKLSALAQLSVKDRDAPLPSSPNLGDIYLVDPGHATDANKVAVWDGPPGAENWVMLTPRTGWTAYVQDEQAHYVYNGTAWTIVETGGGGGSAALGASFRGFRATLGSAFGTAVDTWETVPFDNEEADTDASYSDTSYVFTVPAALDGGYVDFSAGIRYDSRIEGFLEIQRSVDSGSTWESVAAAASKGGSISASTGALLVTDGDQFRVRLETTVSANVQTTPDSFFSGVVLLVPGVSQNEVTAAHSITDANLSGQKMLRANFSSDDTITVPSGLTGKQPVTVVATGPGKVSFAAGAGVTIHSEDGNLKLRSRYSSGTLIPHATAADTYFLVGGLTA